MFECICESHRISQSNFIPNSVHRYRSCGVNAFRVLSRVSIIYYWIKANIKYQKRVKWNHWENTRKKMHCWVFACIGINLITCRVPDKRKSVRRARVNSLLRKKSEEKVNWCESFAEEIKRVDKISSEEANWGRLLCIFNAEKKMVKKMRENVNILCNDEC